eukprot:TRINITY_DN2164_c0_g1_i11.p1 TRINITY_DN2164_c0_g1~~TRINITY_DN2164_c0_g1_i11.p1  ORF type:complete len:353 (+),score=59.46 TRINITY_DN2164_c0_g1_i11:89-1147(+)
MMIRALYLCLALCLGMSGRVLVWAGHVYEYNNWVELHPTSAVPGDESIPHQLHSAIVYQDTIVVWGGDYSTGVNTDKTYVYTYNITANSWTVIDGLTDQPNPNSGVEEHIAALVGSKMMVYGFDQKKSYHYDIVAQNWTRVQDGEETSYRGPAGAMTVDDVYILFGGRSGNGQPKQKWFRYTLDNDVPFASTPTIEPWETPTIPTPAPGQRQGLSGEYYAANNTIFFFAGNTANEATTDELWRYNVTSDTFQNMYTGQAVWPTKRAYYASFIDQTNGYIYYFGGKDDTILYNDLWRYNIEENTWRELRPRGTRPSPRWGATISVYNDLVYLYGGNTGDNLGSSDLWVFDFGM